MQPLRDRQFRKVITLGPSAQFWFGSVTFTDHTASMPPQ